MKCPAAMKYSAKHMRFAHMLRDTVVLMCRTNVGFNVRLNIEGLLGITVDEEEIFLVNFNESLQSDVHHSIGEGGIVFPGIPQAEDCTAVDKQREAHPRSSNGGTEGSHHKDDITIHSLGEGGILEQQESDPNQATFNLSEASDVDTVPEEVTLASQWTPLISETRTLVKGTEWKQVDSETMVLQVPGQEYPAYLDMDCTDESEGYTCQLCPGVNFKTNAELCNHSVLKHDDQVKEGTIRCQFCNTKVCQTYDELFAHVKTCEMQQNLYEEKHKQPGRSIDPTHKCKFCQEKFPSGRTCRMHMKEVHMRGHRFYCEKCDKGYDYRRPFLSHMEGHEVTVQNMEGSIKEPVNEKKSKKRKRYRCTICFKFFKSAKGLGTHMMVHKVSKKTPVVHEELTEAKKEYQCAECNEVFTSKMELRGHMTVHHISSPKQSKGAFKCPICSLRLKRKVTLKLHIAAHKDPYRYKCSGCDAAFGFNSSLINHTKVCKKYLKTLAAPMKYTSQIRIPEGPPYVCKICDKNLKTRDSYKVHMVAHNNPDQYKCKYCSASYGFRSSLLNHYKYAHGDDGGNVDVSIEGQPLSSVADEQVEALAGQQYLFETLNTKSCDKMNE